MCERERARRRTKPITVVGRLRRPSPLTQASCLDGGSGGGCRGTTFARLQEDIYIYRAQARAQAHHHNDPKKGLFWRTCALNQRARGGTASRLYSRAGASDSGRNGRRCQDNISQPLSCAWHPRNLRGLISGQASLEWARARARVASRRRLFVCARVEFVVVVIAALRCILSPSKRRAFVRARVERAIIGVGRKAADAPACNH